MNDKLSSSGSTPAPRSRARERGAETRASLVQAGLTLFARRGFDGTSIREVTREAGVNLGAVTYHFGSKRKLYETVLEAGLSPLVDRVEEAAHREGPALDRIDAVVDVFFDHLAANPALPHLLLQEVAAGKRPPDVVISILRRNVANLLAILSEGWAQGSIRSPSSQSGAEAGGQHPVLFALSVASQPIYLSVISPLLKEVGGLDLQDDDTRRLVAHHVKTFVRAGLESREESHP